MNTGEYCNWDRNKMAPRLVGAQGLYFIQCLLLLSDKHNYMHTVYWFVFDSDTCFGCPLQPSSGTTWFTKRVIWEYVEIKCQLDATEVFIADLIACSTCFEHHYAHHKELNSIIQRLLPVVFRAVVFKLLVWCGAEVYVSGLQDAQHPANRTHNITIGNRTRDLPSCSVVP